MRLHTWSWLRREAECVLGLWLPEDEADEGIINELSEELLSELGLGAEASTLVETGVVCLQAPFWNLLLDTRALVQ